MAPRTTPATTDRTSRMRHSQDVGKKAAGTQNPSEMVRTSSTGGKTTLSNLLTTNGGRRRQQMPDDDGTGATPHPQGTRRASAPGSRLDRWVDAYAERTRGMTVSEIRALFAVASRPEVVSLAGGMPFISALPLDAIADTVARVIRDRGAVALQYGSGQGDVRLREQILEVMAPVGVTAHPDDIVVTAG